ncbi:MAG: GTP 3',8-cyclase MoaA, partial [Candidatus Bipolaricaulia bacterium]
MNDPFGRKIDYLRISVTDRCNLRCRYCMPEGGVQLTAHEELLSFEEIAAVVRCARELGIKKVRLTGGEPLVRRGLATLVEMLADLDLEDLALSTNGTLLRRFARSLKAAGLGRVNVSLDTLDPGRFGWLTRGGRLDEALEGIEAALAVGLQPVKLNAVVIEGVNDDELSSLARFALERGLIIRFIELMPMGEAHRNLGLAYANLEAIQEELIEKLRLKPAQPLLGSGPARYFRPHDGQ